MKKKNKRLLALSLISLFAATIAVGGLSYAAYINKEEHSETFNVDLDYAQYFSGGSGTEADPYIISNADNLKNLSKLVLLGVFNSNHYFELGSDITRQSSDGYLVPIGTDDTPFYSTFNGNGHKISNLLVKGSDFGDNGPFGYVANGATIKNFILDSPRVTATTNVTGGNYSYGYSTISANPFRSIISESQAESISLTATTQNSDETSMTAFRISYSGLPTTYDYELKVSDSSMLSVTKDATNKNWTCTVNTSSTSKYFTAEIYTQGLIEVDGEYRFAQYAIERYKFYYSTDLNGIASGTNDTHIYRKTIRTPNSTVYNGSTSTTYYNKHEIYVGLVVGHLDGKAENIGVMNGTLDCETIPFRANSLLIGKKIDDDDTAQLSKENAFFNKIYASTSLAYSSTQTGSSSAIDYNAANRYLNNIYSDTNSAYMTNSAKDIIKVYGKNNNISTSADPSLKTYKFKGSYTDETGKLITYDDTNYGQGKFLSYNKYLYAAAGQTQSSGSWYQDTTGRKNVLIADGISMWATPDVNNGFWNTLINGSGDFYLTFNIDYLLFDPNYSTSNGSSLGIDMRGVGRKTTLDNYLFFYKSDYYSDPGTSLDTYSNYPLNTVGIGSVGNYSGGYVSYDEDGSDPTVFTSDDINGTSGNSSSIYELKHKDITMVANNSSFWDSTYKRYPYIVFGIKNTSDTSASFEFNILKLSITISNKNGNYAGDPVTVDYFPSSYTGTFDATNQEWPSIKSSNTRVGTTLFSKTANSSGGVDIYSQNYTSYKIYATRSATSNYANTVSITYQYTQGSGSALSSNAIPYNETGFTTASISSGTVS
jgi:hypothetical protein